MNKNEAMTYGVREDAYRAFQEHYNRDARKMAAKMAAEEKGRETAPAALPFPEAIRNAISSILALIADPTRLSMILSSVNRQYQEYQNEQARSKANAENAPETPERGLVDVPED